MSGGDMPCAGCGAPIVGTPDELCFHCEGAEQADFDEGADDLMLHVHEGCRDCGRTLDPFGQCWHCDTYGTPREHASENAL